MLEQPDEVTHQTDSVLVGRTLVDLHQEAIHLRVVNLSHESKIIRRGVTVAKCEPVCCVSIPTSSLSAVTTSGEVRRASSGEIPHHLESLLCQSTKELSVAEKKVVTQLLCEFSDLFSTGTKDLGCRQIDCEQIRSRINQQLIAGRFGPKAFVRCVQN